jgi:hypothetical protein
MLQQTCESARLEDVRFKKCAFLESWTIHARNLLDFFYSPQGPKKQPRTDDVIAEDFFDEPFCWINNRPSPSDRLQELAKRVGREIAHLTYVRTDFGVTGPKWPSGRITNEFRQIIFKFCELVPSERIGQECVRFFKATN